MRSPAEDGQIAALIRSRGPNIAEWRNLQRLVVTRCRLHLGWHRSSDDERSTIDLAIAEASHWLLTEAILGGRWHQDRGASLVGTALRRARFRLIAHQRAARRPGPKAVSLDDDPPSNQWGPEQAVEMIDELATFRDRVGSLNWMLVTQAGQGWPIACLATRFALSHRQVGTRLWRSRQHWRQPE